MKIATFNIDWANKSKSPNHYKKVEEILQKQTFDFLVLTEAIDLNLENYKYKYFSASIPENQIYEGLNYTEFLKGEKAFRTIIYSQLPSIKTHKVQDAKTSLAVEFETEFGNIIIYSSIIGTWFKRKPFVEIELKNCIKDCTEISKLNPNLFIIGDLNTSFIEEEKEFTINETTTKSLIHIFKQLNLFNSTQSIKENIDHIIIPKTFKNKLNESKIFIEKNQLSDHQGICISLI